MNKPATNEESEFITCKDCGKHLLRKYYEKHISSECDSLKSVKRKTNTVSELKNPRKEDYTWYARFFGRKKP